MFTFEMKQFSNSRTIIMGTAMLLVLFFHCGIVLDDLPVLYFFKLTGDIGVDLFLFASGIGSYYALQKYSITDYYRGRIHRIVPAFFLVTLVWSVFYDVLLCGSSFLAVFKNVTGLSFWLDGKLITWYLSSLLITCLLTPLLYNIISPWRQTGYALAIALVVALALLVRLTPLNAEFGHLLIWFCRLPSYLIGLYCGGLAFTNQTIRIHFSAVSALVIFCSLIVWLAMGWGPVYIPFAVKYLAYCPLAVFIAAACSYIPKKQFLIFLGSYSMELYLLHEKVLWVLDISVRKLLPNVHAIPDRKIILNLTALAIACVGAVILKELCRRIFPDRRLDHVQYHFLRPRRKRKSRL